MPPAAFHVTRGTGTPRIRVTLFRENVPEMTLHFTERFLVGTDSSCDVILSDPDVSAVHAEVYPEGGQWFVRSLSTDGETYKDGEAITVAELKGISRVLFGDGGVVLEFEVGGAVPPLTAKLRAVFKRTGYVAVGRHKEIVRRALVRLVRLRSRKYIRVIVALAVVAGIAAVFAYVKHQKVERQEELAREVFYEMKALELLVARLEARMIPDSASRAEADEAWERIRSMNASYDRYISELGIYGEDMDEKEKTIYRVARIFGECEVEMPDGFVKEVMRYIAEWKKSDRLVMALSRADRLGYAGPITAALLEHHLPPQLFYLALQESEFDSSAIGPKTRFGIAKGMWQFIPATAIQYGLKTGPLVDLRKLDPRDDRHRVQKANAAAARYLKDIYTWEAQASGLLVIASYNWGHNAVRRFLREMPNNPRERNFWKFLLQYRDRIPRETYDYVFMIFSAAVIGENPSLFGFTFERPLRLSFD